MGPESMFVWSKEQQLSCVVQQCIVYAGFLSKQTSWIKYRNRRSWG